jgi:hypothetical protein
MLNIIFCHKSALSGGKAQIYSLAKNKVFFSLLLRGIYGLLCRFNAILRLNVSTN